MVTPKFLQIKHTYMKKNEINKPFLPNLLTIISESPCICNIISFKTLELILPPP